VLTWPCAGENKGKKKRGAGRGSIHFIGADGGEGKEGGGLIGGAMQRAMEGGGGASPQQQREASTGP
jgi:hypothetical protein